MFLYENGEVSKRVIVCFYENGEVSKILMESFSPSIWFIYKVLWCGGEIEVHPESCGTCVGDSEGMRVIRDPIRTWSGETSEVPHSTEIAFLLPK